MTTRAATVVLSLAALVAAAAMVWLVWSVAPPPVDPTGLVEPEEPAAPDPPAAPLGLPVHRLQLHLERLSVIPDTAPPAPLYAGVEVSRRGSVEMLTVEGQPWPGQATLEIVAGPAAGHSVVVGGGVRATGLPEGLSLAEVRIPGWPSFQRFLRLRPVGTFGLIGPSAPPCQVRGRVYGPDGKPLGGVLVEVDGRRGHSDAAGDFVVEDVVPGEALFWFSAPGCAPAVHPCMVGHSYPPRPPLFVLRQAVALRGQVIFPDRPTEGVEVFLLPAGQGMGGPRFPFALLGRVRTGLDGNFSFDALPEDEPFLLWAQGEDLVAEGGGVQVGPLGADRRSTPVLVKLRRLPRIHGRVRAAGTPLEEALLRTGPVPSWRPGMARLPGLALADLDGALVSAAVFHPVHRETRTDAEGRFSIALAAPTGVDSVLDCLAPGFLPLRRDRIRPGLEVVLDLEPESEAEEGPPGLLLEWPEGLAGEIRVLLRMDRQAARPEEAWQGPRKYALPLEKPGIYRASFRWRDGESWRTHQEALVVRGTRRLAWPF